MVVKTVLLVVLMGANVAGASKLGWMGEIEDQDKANAHAVGELGRLDPSYERAERVRVQARSVARGAEKMEAVFEKRLAGLLARCATTHCDTAAETNSRRQAHISGLRAQPEVASTAIATAAAAARKPRVEHGSNFLFRLLTSATHPLSVPPSPTAAAAPAKRRSTGGAWLQHAARRVEHGSNTLLRTLTGHTGAPMHSKHHNTLLYHASGSGPSKAPRAHAAALHSGASARKAAVARGSGLAGVAGSVATDARAQLQDKLKKKAQSWFWPFV